jgi:hypothetical protein
VVSLFPLQQRSAVVDAFLDPDDFNQLLVQCIETADTHSQNGPYLIAHAISNNRTKTREKLGYNPQADAFTIFNLQQ